MAAFSYFAYVGVFLIIVVFLLRGFSRARNHGPSVVETNLAYPEKQLLWTTGMVDHALTILDYECLWESVLSATQLNAISNYFNQHQEIDRNAAGVKSVLLAELSAEEQSNISLIMWFYYSGKMGNKEANQQDADYWLDQAVDEKRPYSNFLRAMANLKYCLLKKQWDLEKNIQQDLEVACNDGLAAAIYLRVVFDLSRRKPQFSNNKLLVMLENIAVNDFRPAMLLWYFLTMDTPDFGSKYQDQAQTIIDKLVNSGYWPVALCQKQYLPKSSLDKNSRHLIGAYCTQQLLQLEPGLLTDQSDINNTTLSGELINSVQPDADQVFTYLVIAFQYGRVSALPELLEAVKKKPQLLSESGFVSVFYTGFYYLSFEFELIRFLFFLWVRAEISQEQAFSQALEKILKQSVQAQSVNISESVVPVINLISNTKTQSDFLYQVQLADIISARKTLDEQRLQELLEKTQQEDLSASLLLALYWHYNLQYKDPVLSSLSDTLATSVANSCGALAYHNAQILKYRNDATQSWFWLQRATELNNSQASAQAGYVLSGSYNYELDDDIYKVVAPVNASKALNCLSQAIGRGSLQALKQLREFYLLNYSSNSIAESRKACQTLKNYNETEFRLLKSLRAAFRQNETPVKTSTISFKD